MSNASDLERLSAQLLLLTNGGRQLQPTGLLERLSRGTGLPQMTVRKLLAALCAEGKVDGVSLVGDPERKIRWIGERPPTLSPGGVVLQQQLAVLLPEVHLAERECNRYAQLLDGLSTTDVEGLLRGLVNAASEPQADSILTSAMHLLGSAKALHNLAGLAQLFGVATDQDGLTESFVITAGPANPKAIVLIENTRSFTPFAKSPHVENLLGICAFGYGLTMENFGARLQRGLIRACPAVGPQLDLSQLVFKRPLYWWGDLDLESLRIFESLKSTLPHLQLSAAYESMWQRLSLPHGHHPYHALFEKEGQRAPSGTIPEVSFLAAACRARAVDQECFGENIASLPLDSPYKLPAARHDLGPPP